MKIAILSDTHDLLRPEVVEKLEGCSYILHAGDVSSPAILERLSQIAAVQAVRGNNDGDWAEGLPLLLETELCGFKICMAHKKKDLPKDGGAFDLMICGHSHQWAEVWLNHASGRTLLLNPGSCGPRRFHQPITFALLTVGEDGWTAERVEIPHSPKETAPKLDPGNIKKQIERVIRETEKGRGPREIARRLGMDPALAEQIVRLYVTHPGVTADGIMTKMGL